MPPGFLERIQGGWTTEKWSAELGRRRDKSRGWRRLALRGPGSVYTCVIELVVSREGLWFQTVVGSTPRSLVWRREKCPRVL